MEVHKHPHNVTHKKKWGEYFLEFLMLFLAVFLGFVAENMVSSRTLQMNDYVVINHKILSELREKYRLQ